ncbi:MAG: SBBP repeat-containing protein [bacterium]
MQLFKSLNCFSKSVAVTILLVSNVILGSCGKSQDNRNMVAQETSQLIFSTYLGGSTPFVPGGSALTFAQNTASDNQGNTYVTGATQVSDLPVLNAWQPAPLAGSTLSAFVAKYDPAGNLLWCTYLGGNQQSLGVGVAVMPDGGVAVAGLTSSDASGAFPTMNAFQTQNNGESDYFVAVFDASGNLLYSTYLGGSGVEGTPRKVFTDDNNNGNNIAADAQGLVYITGTTSSGGDGSGTGKFHVTPNAIRPDLSGGTDAFLSIIDPGKSGAESLVYSSFLGGELDDKGHGVAASGSGSYITVAGYTKSLNFPTTANAYRNHHAPSGYTSNGFVSQFTSSLPGDPSSQYSARYSTYLGADASDARDDTYAVALDSNGFIVATGRTQSADFPMVKPPVPTIYNSASYLKPGTSNDESFLVKIDPSLTGEESLVYSTFLGGGSPNPGGGGAFCTSVAVDTQGGAYVGGETSSQGIKYTPSSVPTPTEAPSQFPYTGDALYPALQGSFDAILMQISPDGATLAYSTFFGGTGNDRTYGLAVDPSGNIILTGLTFSSDFPLKNPAQPWPGNTGNQNAFVTKLRR